MIAKKTKSIEKSETAKDAPAHLSSRQPAPVSLQSTSGLTEVQQAAGNFAMQSLARSGTIQTKLTVSQPGDLSEQEADRVAEQVMRMPTPPSATNAQIPVQRQAPAADEMAQTKPLAATMTPLVQRAPSDSTGSFAPGANFEARLRTSGGGSPLPASTRAFMEPRFGADFSGVRLHTGSEAAQLNRAVSAQAFTHRQDIYLGEGKNNLESSVGKQLLAHELTHVVQQKGSAQVQRQPTPTPLPTSAVPTTAPATEPNPQEIWGRIEPNVIRELLIKLQEIGRAAGTQTQDQINSLFSPYEDSLESDQTFLQVMSIPLGGGANAPQGGGTKAEVAGGLAGAAAAAAQLAMTKIMDFKSVGLVKAKAGADIGAVVTNLFTSDSSLYMNFETEALQEMRTEFDTSWSNMTPEAKSAPREIIDGVYSSWYPMIARQKYGVASSQARTALAAARSQVDRGLGPVRIKLDDLKNYSQKWRRTGAGALGGATAGALLGGALGAGVFSVPGALIGGAIGAVVGGVGGYFW